MTAHRRHKSNNPSGSDRTRKADVVAIPASSQPQASEPQANAERIGDILRRTREKRGDDIGHIAEYLCIRRSYLEAIEKSDYEKFPADTYVIGFLRSYADLLGLDGKEAINYYRAEMAGRRKKSVLSMPTPMPEGRSPSVFILIGAVITAILVYAMWYGLSTSDRATVSAAPPAPPLVSSTVTPPPMADMTMPAVNATSAVPIVPVTTTSAAAPAPALQATQPTPAAEAVAAPVQKSVAQEAAPVPTAAAAPKPTHLTIRAEQSSWVMITDSKGATVFDRVLKPGETYKVPDEQGLALTTGNGAGLILTLDGIDLPKLSMSVAPGSSGIIRNIPLDGTRLRALTQGR